MVMGAGAGAGKGNGKGFFRAERLHLFFKVTVGGKKDFPGEIRAPTKVKQQSEIRRVNYAGDLVSCRQEI